MMNPEVVRMQLAIAKMRAQGFHTLADRMEHWMIDLAMGLL